MSHLIYRRFLFLTVILSVCKMYELRTYRHRTKMTKLLEIIEDDVRVSAIESDCSNLPKSVLTEVLGSAFNSRYMSIEEPKYITKDINDELQDSGSKRESEDYRPFYVDDTYSSEISHKPAWEVKHVTVQEDRVKRSLEIDKNDQELNIERDKRALTRRVMSKFKNGERPWECEAKIKWIDLGIDYFPRFLRTVECTKHDCWYGHYTCKPRSFTVKILRRRAGECVPANGIRNIGTAGLPVGLKELWVWEERAVNFCCDCSAN